MEIEDIQPVIDRVVDSYSEHGLEAMNEPDKVFFLVYTYATEVDNGGHAQYFYNSWADHYRQTVEALRALGLPQFAGQLQSAAAALFNGDVPATIDQRNAVLDSLADEPGNADEAIETADEEFDKLGGGDQVLEKALDWLRAQQKK